MEDPDVYDEDDYRPAMSGEPPLSPDNNDGENANVATATPESRPPQAPIDYEDPLEAAEAAAAAAETAVLEGRFNQTTRRGGRDPTADRAIMGANRNVDGAEDGVQAVEATDESGELVRGAFEEFLQN